MSKNTSRESTLNTATSTNFQLVRRVYSDANWSLLDLSFVAETERVGGRRRINYWSVPPAPSYRDACNMGRQYAAEFVQSLIDNPNRVGMNSIGTFVTHMADHQPGDTRRGYQVGFWASLEELLLVAGTRVDHWAVLQARQDKMNRIEKARQAEEAAAQQKNSARPRTTREKSHE